MTGRRARNIEDKRARIFTSARRLMATHGFDGVTTQQISEDADVAAGTLFRYASNKGELLLMVLNHEFEAAIDAGETAAQASAEVAGVDPVEGVWALVEPVLRFADGHPDNTAAYQRELLFGPTTDRYRAEGLGLVSRWQAAVAQHLLRTAVPASPAQQAEAEIAARSAFAVLHLAVVSPSTDASGTERLRAQIAQLVDGYRGRATATVRHAAAPDRRTN